MELGPLYLVLCKIAKITLPTVPPVPNISPVSIGSSGSPSGDETQQAAMIFNSVIKFLGGVRS